MTHRSITIAAIAAALLASGLYVAHHLDERRLYAAATQASTSLRGPIIVLPEVVVRAPRPGQVVSNDFATNRTEIEEAYLPTCAEIEVLYRDAERPNRRDESPTRPCHGPILLSAVEVHGARQHAPEPPATDRATASRHIAPGIARSSTDGIEFAGISASAELDWADDMPFFDFAGALR